MLKKFLSPYEIHLPGHRKCAAHTLNLVASVDASNHLSYCEMAKPLFVKSKSLWRKQMQSVQESEAVKNTLGRLLPVPNTTGWNSLFNSMQVINQVPKARLDATCSALSLPKLQREEFLFLDEYCKICYEYFLHFVQCTEFNIVLDDVCGGKVAEYFARRGGHVHGCPAVNSPIPFVVPPTNEALYSSRQHP